MRTTEEKYHLIIDSNSSGTYYVSYSSIGGGSYEFFLNKKPYKHYDSLQEILPLKELLERVVKYNGVMDNDNYIHIDSDIIKEVGGIKSIKIQKSVIVSNTIITYID